MKYLLAVLSLFVLSCSDNGDRLVDQPSQTPVGQMSFSFSGTTIPQNIASLSFTLENLTTSESVSRVVSTTSDSIMLVVFDQLHTGVWHVKIEATDPSNGKLYLGEADATVTAGQATQLVVTLTPTTPATGSLNIMVIWGGTTSFHDYPSNPILQKTGAWYDTRGVAYPSILFDNGKYKMWFMNYGILNGPFTTIGLAESVDGTNWTRIADTVLTPTPNSWDAGLVVPGAVIKDNGQYIMYYMGARASGVGYNVGIATSQDGQHWSKKPNPILPGVQNIGGAGVVKVNGQYFLYYYPSPSSSVNLATSVDGMNWQVYQGNPVLTASLPWEGSAITNGSVIYENNTFTMAYNNIDMSHSFGLATSTDGIHWTKDPHNPVFSKANTTTTWYPYIVAYPHLVRVGNELRIYYTGISSEGIDRIGFAFRK
jgi:beta-1,2-mannobiose phosphorylase / 1,2-beta-oligomannan phosphorylase